jgi:hypothetical protein
MHLLLAAAGIGAVLATLLATDATAQCARTQLTGVWQSDDGGTYAVRRSGNLVWWVGESKDGGRSFTNVFKGVVNGSTITGDWADVRNANGFQSSTNKGTLTLQLDGTLNNLFGFRKVSATGGFGGTRWSFPCGGGGLHVE